MKNCVLCGNIKFVNKDISLFKIHDTNDSPLSPSYIQRHLVVSFEADTLGAFLTRSFIRDNREVSASGRIRVEWYIRESRLDPGSYGSF
jgi:hypothetical protein